MAASVSCSLLVHSDLNIRVDRTTHETGFELTHDDNSYERDVETRCVSVIGDDRVCECTQMTEMNE